MHMTHHSRRIVFAPIILVLSIILLTFNAGTHKYGDTNPKSVNDNSENRELCISKDKDKTDTSATLSAEEVFVQHDEKNQDKYLLSSQGDSTIVYQIINVKLTAGKQWTETGLYVDNLENTSSATSPDQFINVKEKEIYFVRLFGLHDDYIGEKEDITRITPILFKDDNDNVVGSAMGGTYSDGEDGIELTVPDGATKMYVTCTNFHVCSVQKKLVMNNEQFNQIKSMQDTLLNSLDSNYEDYKRDPILYDEFDKAYITFVDEGANDDIDKVADLFISENVPLSFATYPENLLNVASDMTETRLDVALRIQESGGEILARNYQVATQDKLDNNEFLYEYFVSTRQRMTNMGLNVNGIILTGGKDQVKDSPKTARWVYSTYNYSDSYGEQYTSPEGFSSVYNRWGGKDASSFNSNAQSIKEYIDEVIQNKGWAVFGFQGLSDFDAETMIEVLDYIKSKGSAIEITTYRAMYNKFARKESEIHNTVKTYYVSADGTSVDGTDINDPICLDVLNTKKIKTGDTILFKCGDTFFGSVEPQIFYTNDKTIKISSYGNGDLPTISAYKYVDKKWDKYRKNIYRIDILDKNNYSGYNQQNPYAFNVGFIEDNNGNKYYHKKKSIDQLTEQYDFYSDGERYIYMQCNRDPYDEFGGLKLAVNIKLFMLSSNMDISNLRFAITGGHAVQALVTPAKNIKISNCVIEDIGGSYLNTDYEERYGNGIEFYSSDAENVEVTDTIIRNVYDVGFTIQGDSGSGQDVLVHDNVFVNNAQDSEIWEGDEAGGVYNYQFYNNISINQGRGWGYDARQDQDASAHILFYEYYPKTADIRFHDNLIYNPLRVYSIKPSMQEFFTNDFIYADNNTYYMAEDARIFNYIFPLGEKDDFINWAHKEDNSSFSYLSEIDQDLINIACSSDSIDSIRKQVDAILMN